MGRSAHPASHLSCRTRLRLDPQATLVALRRFNCGVQAAVGWDCQPDRKEVDRAGKGEGEGAATGPCACASAMSKQAPGPKGPGCRQRAQAGPLGCGLARVCPTVSTVCPPGAISAATCTWPPSLRPAAPAPSLWIPVRQCALCLKPDDALMTTGHLSPLHQRERTSPRPRQARRTFPGDIVTGQGT